MLNREGQLDAAQVEGVKILITDYEAVLPSPVTSL